MALVKFLLLEIAIAVNLCSATLTGSVTVMMMTTSLTVTEGGIVLVCVMATLGAGESVVVGLTSTDQQGDFLCNQHLEFHVSIIASHTSYKNSPTPSMGHHQKKLEISVQSWRVQLED